MKFGLQNDGRNIYSRRRWWFTRKTFINKQSITSYSRVTSERWNQITLTLLWERKFTLHTRNVSLGRLWVQMLNAERVAKFFLLATLTSVLTWKSNARLGAGPTWVKCPTVRRKTPVKNLGYARGDGRCWNWLVHQATTRAGFKPDSYL